MVVSLILITDCWPKYTPHSPMTQGGNLIDLNIHSCLAPATPGIINKTSVLMLLRGINNGRDMLATYIPSMVGIACERGAVVIYTIS